MRKIAKDIQDERFSPVYLLYGEEDYLRKQYRDRLVRALADPEDTMNYHYFEGDHIVAEKLIDLAETLPFLAERRVIVVENSGFFTKAQDKLADYLAEMPDTTVFVFVEKKVEKRGRLFRACKDAGYATEFTVQTEQTLKNWIMGRIQKEGKQITLRALDEFLERTGSDMENIAMELEKLFCYTLEKPDITSADVEEICIRQLNNRIFQMVDNVATKRQKAALELYYDLIALKEDPAHILYMIVRQFNLLIQTKQLRKQGYDNKTIGEKLSMKDFAVKKCITQASKFSAEEIRDILAQCADTEESFKTGKMNAMLAVELLIVKLSS